MIFSFTINQNKLASIFSLKGKITSDTDLEKITTEINKSIEANNNKLIFNTEELEYINSTGINFFMRTLTKSRVNNGDLIFFGINGAVENVFKITKLNKIYTIYTSENEALNHFKNEIE
jgi:anti-sigma B factor antagonist